MSHNPRSLYRTAGVQTAEAATRIVKYMPFTRFADLVRRSALYFRRIDCFPDDACEGTIPLAVWALNSPAIQNWYSACRERVFVNCWNLDEDEQVHMWNDYAQRYGVRVRSTVGMLEGILSQPPIPAAAPYPPEILAYAATTGMRLDEVNETPQDGFTVGVVEYIDFNGVDEYEMLREGVSSVLPMFRKRAGFVREHELRAILRAGSVAAESARSNHENHAWIDLRLCDLIQEVRFAPSSDGNLGQQITDLLQSQGVNVPVIPSAVL